MADDPTPNDAVTQIHVVGGNPSTEHAAAAIAVVAGMLVEGGAVDTDPGSDLWDKSARAPRPTVDRARDTWNSLTPQ